MRISRAFIRPGQIGGNRQVMSAGTQMRLRMQLKIRGGMDQARIRRSVGEMNARCLAYCGTSIKNAAKKGIGGGKGKITGAARKRMQRGQPVEFVGGLYKDITAYGSGESRPAGQPIRSWAPKRFMYSDIINDYDYGTKTQVIGTYKAAHWLAQLHQFGGTVKETAWRVGVGAARNAYLRKQAGGAGRDARGRYTRGSGGPQRNQFEYGLLRWHVDKAGKFRGANKWERTSMTRMARYPSRPYMQGSEKVVAALAKANEKWRNQLKRAG